MHAGRAEKLRAFSHRTEAAYRLREDARRGPFVGAVAESVALFRRTRQLRMPSAHPDGLSPGEDGEPGGSVKGESQQI